MARKKKKISESDVIFNRVKQYFDSLNQEISKPYYEAINDLITKHCMDEDNDQIIKNWPMDPLLMYIERCQRQRGEDTSWIKERWDEMWKR